jgi:hypothetical protein
MFTGLRSYRQPIGGRGDPRRDSDAASDSETSCSSSSTPRNFHNNANVLDSENDDRNEPLADANDIYDFDFENNNNWRWPSGTEIRNNINNLPDASPSKTSWQALIDHEKFNKKNANIHWKPFRNILCFFLWIGRHDPSIRWTRKQLQWILDVLRSVKDAGFITNDLWIPTDASTIEKWDNWFPMPPIC